MDEFDSKPPRSGRRDFIRTGLAVAGGLVLPGMPGRLLAAENHPPLGTWPDGAKGQLGLHRHRRAAHRHVCGAGRG
jgi:hypothetical protein